MADAGELLRRLIDDVEHAESLGLPVVAIDDVLPVLRSIRDELYLPNNQLSNQQQLGKD